jgi:hypothetical protein
MKLETLVAGFSFALKASGDKWPTEWASVREVRPIQRRLTALDDLAVPMSAHVTDLMLGDA